MKIESVKIEDLKLNPANPRTIKDEKFAQLVRSVRDFPQMLKIRPIVVNDKMEVLGGNMRLRACIEAGISDVPIIRASELTEDQQREFIIKDNIGFGEWDWDALSNEWDSMELSDWGLDVPDFAFGGNSGEVEEDNFEMPDEIKTDIVPGDLFEIGPHRLLCGDSTSAESWARLEIEKTAACFTSPPYNVGEGSKLSGNKTAAKKGNFYEDHNDSMSDSEYLALLNNSILNAVDFCGGAVFNVQPLAKNKVQLLDWIISNKGNFKDIITWDKGHAAPAMAGSVLSSRFEWLVIFGNDKTRSVPLSSWRGTLSNVYQAPAQRSNEYSSVHAATFPVHLPTFVMADLMNRCTAVVDCFMGTGTTMVAAHQLNRKCYGMEIDPKYCQVIIDRMLKLDPDLVIKKNGKKYDKRKETATDGNQEKARDIAEVQNA